MYGIRDLLDLPGRSAVRVPRLAWLQALVDDWPIWATAIGYIVAVPIAMRALGVGHLHRVNLLYWELLWLHLTVGLIVAVVQFGNRRLLQWLRERAVSGVLLWMLLTPVFDSFTSWKQGFFHWAPYHWGAPLHRLDTWLHGGPAWEWFAPLLTPGTLVLLDWLYIAWFLVMTSAVSVALWALPLPLRRRFLMASLLLWICLGSVLAPVFASGGPCYYAQLTGQPDAYAPLWSVLDANDLRARDLHGWLWDVVHRSEWHPFIGISAMPSLHVAHAMLLGVLARESRTLGIQAAAMLYVAAIQVGSVVLGWHYAIDGYVSIISTALIWRALAHLER